MAKKIIYSLLMVCFGAYFSATNAAETEVTLKFIESKPKGLVRDFYIWRFINQDSTSLQDATKAYELVYRYNAKLRASLDKKGYRPDLNSEPGTSEYCANLMLDDLLKQDVDCIAKGMNISKILRLSDEEANRLKVELKDYKVLVKKIEILHSKDILEAALNSDAGIFSNIFASFSTERRMQVFNKKISPKDLKKIASEDNGNFNSIIQKAILYDDMPLFAESLLGMNVENLHYKTSFLLGIHELRAGNKKNALFYFSQTENSARRLEARFFIDKAIFWQYMVSGDKDTLRRLADSTDLNLYAIYAKQKLHKDLDYSIVVNFENLKTKKPKIDISDPFAWEKISTQILQTTDIEELKKLSENFVYVDTIAHYAYLHNRITGFKNFYFLTPLADKITWNSSHEKAMVYAIARQESLFLPSLISTSYALGMMQIMPFNVAPFARELNVQDVRLSDMFNPQISLEFGRHYLNVLEKRFDHPLFVFYAYNGGPTFLRGVLNERKFFKKGSKYEPWLSMELIPYEETRIYGFKVLANYIVYQALFERYMLVEDLLQGTLIN